MFNSSKFFLCDICYRENFKNLPSGTMTQTFQTLQVLQRFDSTDYTILVNYQCSCEYQIGANKKYI